MPHEPINFDCNFSNSVSTVYIDSIRDFEDFAVIEGQIVGHSFLNRDIDIAIFPKEISQAFLISDVSFTATVTVVPPALPRPRRYYCDLVLLVFGDGHLSIGHHLICQK